MEATWQAPKASLYVKSLTPRDFKPVTPLLNSEPLADSLTDCGLTPGKPN